MLPSRYYNTLARFIDAGDFSSGVGLLRPTELSLLGQRVHASVPDGRTKPFAD